MKKIISILFILFLVGCVTQEIEVMPEPAKEIPEELIVESGKLYVFNSLTNELVHKIDIGNAAGLEATNTHAYVSDKEEGVVRAVDLSSFEVNKFVAGSPTGITLSPAEEVLAVASKEDAMLRVFDLSGTELITVEAGLNPVAVIYTPEGKYALVTSTDGKVYKINTLVKQVVEQGPSGMLPNDLIVADEKLFVANKGSNDVAVLDVINMKKVSSVKVGKKPQGMTVDSDNVYVTNNEDNTVSVISIEQMEVVDTIDVGLEPAGIAFNPLIGNRGTIYTANRGTVSVVDLSTKNIKTIEAEGTNVVVTPDGKYFIVA